MQICDIFNMVGERMGVRLNFFKDGYFLFIKTGVI